MHRLDGIFMSLRSWCIGLRSILHFAEPELPRALMQKAEEVAVERGIDALRVDTNTQNEATQRLFPEAGLSACRRDQFAVQAGLRFFCYEKRLPVD